MLFNVDKKPARDEPEAVEDEAAVDELDEAELAPVGPGLPDMSNEVNWNGDIEDRLAKADNVDVGPADEPAKDELPEAWAGDSFSGDM